MKIIEPEINSDDPWNHDVLGRHHIAKALTPVLTRNPHVSFVVSLNGAWGTGKTFFLKRYEAYLKKGGIDTIYFNAWEDDFYENPLIAIIGQLYDFFKDKTEFKNQFDKFIKLAKIVVSGMVKKSSGIEVDKLAETADGTDSTFETYR